MAWNEKARLTQTPHSTEPSGKRYLVHVRQDADGSFAIHDLGEHLRAVSRTRPCVVPRRAPKNDPKNHADVNGQGRRRMPGCFGRESSDLRSKGVNKGGDAHE